jgi:hypothetical protein
MGESPSALSSEDIKRIVAEARAVAVERQLEERRADLEGLGWRFLDPDVPGPGAVYRATKCFNSQVWESVGTAEKLVAVCEDTERRLGAKSTVEVDRDE